jgi:hypothetical protein
MTRDRTSSIAIALLLLAVVLLSIVTIRNYSAIGTAQHAVAANQRSDTKALCALRADLQTRVNSTNAFLKGHPHGIPGISAATLRSGIVNQQHTIMALSTISCRPF